MTHRTCPAGLALADSGHSGVRPRCRWRDTATWSHGHSSSSAQHSAASWLQRCPTLLFPPDGGGGAGGRRGSGDGDVGRGEGEAGTGGGTVP